MRASAPASRRSSDSTPSPLFPPPRYAFLAAARRENALSISRIGLLPSGNLRSIPGGNDSH